MELNIGGNAFLIIAVLVFVTVLLLLEGLYLLWRNYKGPEAKKIEKRLRALSASVDTTAQAQLLKQRMLSEVPFLERLLLNVPRAHTLDRLILQAGLEWTVSKLLLYGAVLGLAGFLLIVGPLHEAPLLGCLLYTSPSPRD